MLLRLVTRPFAAIELGRPMLAREPRSWMSCQTPYGGTRLTGLGTVLGLLATGETRERILQAYPYLEPPDIDEALGYAAWRLQKREEALSVA